MGNVYPNKFERSDVTETASHEDTITSIVEAFKNYEPEISEGEKPSADVLESTNNELNKTRVRIAGRIAAPPRVMGKAAFLHLSDGVSRLQMYIRRQDVAGLRNDSEGGEVDGWELFGLLDHGDFIGVGGFCSSQKQASCRSMLRSCNSSQRPCCRCRTRCTAYTTGNSPAPALRGSDCRQPETWYDEHDCAAGSFRVALQDYPRDSTVLDEHGYVEVETPC